MFRVIQHCLLLGVCCLLVVACQGSPPPLEFAPDGAVVKQAILLQLSQTQAKLSQNLNANQPEFTVSKIAVEDIDAITVNRLPTYRLKGTYSLKLKLPRQTVKQPRNPFDVYLQRQSEGESWRLLRRDIDPASQEAHWTTYLIAPTAETTETTEG